MILHPLRKIVTAYRAGDNMRERLQQHMSGTLREVVAVYVTLLKFLLPALVVVKVLEWFGVTEWVAALLAPLMAALGLPEQLSIVWAATLLTNIYAGMVVFFDLAANQSLTVAQVTVLGTLMVVAHGLPVEGAAARRAGVPWWVTLLLRIGGGLMLGRILHLVYQSGGWLQQPNRMIWEPAAQDSGLLHWLWSQGQMLIIIFVVIGTLITLLRLLRALGIERVLHAILTPPLRLLGIGRDAANTMIVGVTLGISFGAGLIIQDVDSGRMSRRDTLLCLSFLGICHSVIEDTLVVMTLGADLSGILLARVLFAFLVIALLARLPLPAIARNKKAC